jgi:hypothetical protein
LRALGYDQPNWATILTRKPQMPLDRPMIRPESEFDNLYLRHPRANR